MILINDPYGMHAFIQTFCVTIVLGHLGQWNK
jgi:hypothetical protein